MLKRSIDDMSDMQNAMDKLVQSGEISEGLYTKFCELLKDEYSRTSNTNGFTDELKYISFHLHFRLAQLSDKKKRVAEHKFNLRSGPFLNTTEGFTFDENSVRAKILGGAELESLEFSNPHDVRKLTEEQMQSAAEHPTEYPTELRTAIDRDAVAFRGAELVLIHESPEYRLEKRFPSIDGELTSGMVLEIVEEFELCRRVLDIHCESCGGDVELHFEEGDLEGTQGFELCTAAQDQMGV